MYRGRMYATMELRIMPETTLTTLLMAGELEVGVWKPFVWVVSVWRPHKRHCTAGCRLGLGKLAEFLDRGSVFGKFHLGTDWYFARHR